MNPKGNQTARRKDKSKRSSLVTHTVYVDRKRTTVRLEPVIWHTLQGIASEQEVRLHDLVSTINRNRIASSLTSAIRAYVVTYLIAQAPPEALPRHLFS